MDTVVPLAMPTNLSEAVAEHGQGALRDWYAQLPERVAGLARRWSLRLRPPFQPGGRCSWVAPARDGAGREVVLKVGWTHDEAVHEADGLLAWRDRGAVRLHDVHVDGPTTALLMQRCRPGTPLGEALPEPEQDVVVAGLLRRLRHVPPDGHPFRPLEQMCGWWASEAEAEFAARPGLLDPGIAAAGLELFRVLPASAPERVLLATDLHAGNVLAAAGEPWQLIDPKPYVGDPAYDVLQHLLNCEERLLADPLGLARRFADLAQLRAERVTLWLFARCVQESPGRPELAAAAEALARHCV